MLLACSYHGTLARTSVQSCLLLLFLKIVFVHNPSYKGKAIGMSHDKYFAFNVLYFTFCIFLYNISVIINPVVCLISKTNLVLCLMHP